MSKPRVQPRQTRQNLVSTLVTAFAAVQLGVNAQECPLGELYPNELQQQPSTNKKQNLGVQFKQQWTRSQNDAVPPELLKEDFYCYAQAQDIGIQAMYDPISCQKECSRYSDCEYFMYEPLTGRCYWSKTQTKACREGYGPFRGWNFYRKADQRTGRLGLGNAGEDSETPDLGTSYPGVTKDNIVSYLNLNSEDTALLSSLGFPENNPNNQQEFTIGWFFKLDEEIRNYDSAGTQWKWNLVFKQNTHINGDGQREASQYKIHCYVNEQLKFACEGINTSYDLKEAGENNEVDLDEWFYVLLSGAEGQENYWQISQSSKSLKNSLSENSNSVNNDEFEFGVDHSMFEQIQLGGIDAKLNSNLSGIKTDALTGDSVTMGGIREFKYLNEFTTLKTENSVTGLLELGHEQQAYSINLKAYYRFNSQSYDEKFKTETYHELLTATIECRSGTSCYGVDIAPNDVCLQNINWQNFVTFGESGLKVDPLQINSYTREKINEFDYTFFMTIQAGAGQEVIPRIDQNTGRTEAGEKCNNVSTPRAERADACRDPFQMYDPTYVADVEYVVDEEDEPPINHPTYAETVDQLFANQLFGIENLFTVYYSSEDTIRFHFITENSENDKFSSELSVPYGVWYNIQMRMKNDGYKIVISDLNIGTTIQEDESEWIDSQVPNFMAFSPNDNAEENRQAYMLRGFKGEVDRIMLCDTTATASDIPHQEYHDIEGCFIDLSFKESDGTIEPQNNLMRNGGSDPADLIFNQQPTFIDKIYQETDEGSNTNYPFDGIACKDDHHSVLISGNESSNQSHLKFKTVALTDQKDFTIEFWFRFNGSDEDYNSENAHIFSMHNPSTKGDFLFIGMQNGKLICRPFGTAEENKFISFEDEFKKENEDALGWWHITCSMSNNSVQGNLFSRGKIGSRTPKQINISTISSGLTFPGTGSMQAVFGHQVVNDALSSPKETVAGGFMVKEIRLWAEQRSDRSYLLDRNKQIDPTSTKHGQIINKKLISYYRLHAQPEKNYYINFARFNPNDDFDFTENDLNEFQPLEGLETVDFQASYSSDATHVVCPLHTTYSPGGERCFASDTQIWLIVLPDWDEASSLLSWRFKLLFSKNFVDSEIMDLIEFDSAWTADDFVLQWAFKYGEGVKDGLDMVIPYNYFRDEATYNIQVDLQDANNNFNYHAFVNFVPSLSHWMHPEPCCQAIEGRQLYEEEPVPVINRYLVGEDITFQLMQKKNNRYGFQHMNRFYDYIEEGGISFHFLEHGTANLINEFFKPQADIEYPQGPCYPATILFRDTELAKLEDYYGTDIDIIMKIRWTSSNELIRKYLQDSQSILNPIDRFIMQHAVYTIRIERPPEQLIPVIRARKTDGGIVNGFVLQNEDIVFDAYESGVFINGVKQYEGEMTFSWACEEPIASLCNSLDSRLNLNWSDVNDKQSILPGDSQTFKITLTATWTPDNESSPTTGTETMNLQWLNVARLRGMRITQAPQSSFSLKPNKVFSLFIPNMEYGVLDLYNINWTLIDRQNRIVGSVENQQTFDAHEYMLEEDVQYMLDVELTFENLPSYKESAQTYFTVHAPPKNGRCQISDQEVIIGDQVSFWCSGWQSPHQPLTFKVYQNQKMIGPSDGQPMNGEFYAIVTEKGSYLIAVTDSQGETSWFELNPDIATEHERIEGIFQTVDQNLDGKIDAEEWGIYITRQLLSMEFSVNDLFNSSGIKLYYDLFDQCDEDFNGFIDFTEFFNFSRDFQDQHNFIAQIRRIVSQTQGKKVEVMRRIQKLIKYLNVDVMIRPQDELEQQVNSLYLTKGQGKEEICMQILDELQLQIDQFDINNDRQLNIEEVTLIDYMNKMLTILAKVLQLPQSSEILVKAHSVLDDFAHITLYREINNTDQIYSKYFECLELLQHAIRNDFGGQTAIPEFETWLATQIQYISNQICNNLPQDFAFNYRKHGEIELQIQKVAKSDPRTLSLNALDAKFKTDSSQFAQKLVAESLCVQFQATRLVDKVNTIEPYGQTSARMSLFEPLRAKSYHLQDAMNTIEVDFAMNAASSNSTVCMGRMYTEQGYLTWQSQMCTTTLNVASLTVSCKCSVNLIDTITIVNSEFEGTIYANPLNLEIESPLAEIDQSSNLLVAYMAITNVLIMIVSQSITFCKEKDDQKQEVKQQRTFQSQVDFLEQVAMKRKESIQSINGRKEEINKYRVVQSRFMYTTLALHPLMNPFSGPKRNMSRLLSLNTYLLQINAVQIGALFLFSNLTNQSYYSSNLLGEPQMNAMNLIMSIGSIFLLPVVSEPLAWMTTQPCLLKTDLYAKWILTIFNFALGITTCFLAGKFGATMTVNDQICFVVSLSLAFILGIFGWNMLRIVLNWVLSPYREKNWVIRGLTAEQAEEIYLDMQAVKMIMEDQNQKGDESTISHISANNFSSLPGLTFQQANSGFNIDTVIQESDVKRHSNPVFVPTKRHFNNPTLEMDFSSRPQSEREGLQIDFEEGDAHYSEEFKLAEVTKCDKNKE